MKQFFYLLKLLDPLIEDALTFFFFGETDTLVRGGLFTLINF